MAQAQTFDARKKDLSDSKKQPHDYSRRFLIAVTGLSPQIVTETLYALAVEQKPPFIPTEIRLITTEKGAERARSSLLHPESGRFHHLCADYALPPIVFESEHIYVLTDIDGAPLTDIRSPSDNTHAADAITDMVRELTQDCGSALHVSIAGGRKTMGFYLGYALSLYGREQDRLSHVLVNPPYESHPEFFYPTTASQIISTLPPHNRSYDARDAEITLAIIPFVRLRGELPEDLLDEKARFGDAVLAAQQSIEPADLIIDLPAKRLCIVGKVIALSPVQLAFLAWLARRRKHGQEFVECPPPGVPEPGHGSEFLAEYRQIIGVLGDDERTAKRLLDGMTNEFFSQTKSKLHRSLKKKLGWRRVLPYLVSRRRSRSRWLYGLDLAPSAIRFEALERDDNPGSKVVAT